MLAIAFLLSLAAGPVATQPGSTAVRVYGSLVSIEADLKERIASDPGRVDLYMELASLYEAVEHGDDAERVLGQALLRASRPRGVYEALLAHLRRRKQYDRAVPVAEEWRGNEPDGPDPLVALAWLHLYRASRAGEQRLDTVARGLNSADAALAARPEYGPAFEVKRQLLALKWILSDPDQRRAIEAEQRVLDRIYTPPPRIDRPARSWINAPPPRPAMRTPDGRVPLRLDGDLGVPARTVFVEPRYPTAAIEKRIQGTVRVELLIDEAGLVQDARAPGSETVLADAAVEAVRRWRYEPTLLYGKPVPVVLVVRVEFVLTLGRE